MKSTNTRFFVVDPWHEVDEHTFAVSVSQRTADALVFFGSDVVFVFDSDLELIGINGVIHDEALPADATGMAMSPTAAAELASLSCGREFNAVGPLAIAVELVPERRWALHDGLATETHTFVDLEYEPLSERVAWVVRDQAGYALVSEDASCLSTGSYNLAANKQVDLHRRRYTANNFEQGFDNSTSPTARHYVGYNALFGTCYYQARYDSSTLPIDRVVDHRWAEVEVAAGCSSIPDLPSSSAQQSFSHSNYREGDLLYHLKQGRAFAVGNVTNSISGWTSRPLHPRINTYWGTGSDECPSGAGACYGLNSNKLKVVGTGGATQGENNRGNYDADNIWHEYAHHIHRVYKDINPSPGCIFQVDEAAAIRESYANLMAPIIGAHQLGYVGAQYDIGMTVNAVHRGSARDYGDSTTCPSGQALGDFFEQAAWEAVWSVDCHDPNTDCTETSPATNGEHATGWSPANGRRHMARAMTYSLEVGSSGVRTFSNFAFWTWVWLVNNVSTASANDFRAILADHGLTF